MTMSIVWDGIFPISFFSIWAVCQKSLSSSKNMGKSYWLRSQLHTNDLTAAADASLK